MAEKIVVQNPDHFTLQAQKHRQMADHTRQILGTYQAHHDNLIAATANSCMGEAMQAYMDWWENFSSHMHSHADLHEQMAGHLDKALASYSDTETNIQQSLTPTDPMP